MFCFQICSADGAHDLSEGEKKKESQREDEELGEDVNEPEP